MIGLGERAGNAPLEEVAVALTQLYGRETGITLHQLGKVAALVPMHRDYDSFTGA